jgi:hypothetical protein
MADKIVNEIFEELSKMCELDEATIAAIRPNFLAVIQKNMALMTTTVAPADAPESTGKKVKKASTRKVGTKSDKIPHKNGYHFFVAAKMGEVKAAGVGAKDRMKKIGDMWKELVEEGRKPYQEKARLYNESVDNEMKLPDWAARRTTIVDNANLTAGVASKKGAEVVVPEAVVEEAAAAEEEEEEGAVEVVPVAPVVPVVPVAPVATVKTGPIRRTKKTA